VQDRKRQKVEVLKPVEPKVEEKVDPAPEDGAGVDAEPPAVGEPSAGGKQPDSQAVEEVQEQEPEVSTESDEARPGKEGEEVSLPLSLFPPASFLLRCLPAETLHL